MPFGMAHQMTQQHSDTSARPLDLLWEHAALNNDASETGKLSFL